MLSNPHQNKYHVIEFIAHILLVKNTEAQLG